jgi:hypothetical protein
MMNIPAIALASGLVGTIAIYYSENYQGYFSDSAFALVTQHFID